jgi:hypothetical protein
VDFSYDVKIIQSHPYFTLEPKRGIVPANGCVDFRITFNPVTLGSCTLKLQLTIGNKDASCIQSISRISLCMQSISAIPPDLYFNLLFGHYGDVQVSTALFLSTVK